MLHKEKDHKNACLTPLMLFKETHNSGKSCVNLSNVAVQLYLQHITKGVTNLNKSVLQNQHC